MLIENLTSAGACAKRCRPRLFAIRPSFDGSVPYPSGCGQAREMLNIRFLEVETDYGIMKVQVSFSFMKLVQLEMSG